MATKIQSLLGRLRDGGQRTQWILWACINFSIAGYFIYALFAPASNSKTAWLPGETTHGHYQIELDCDACHDPSKNGDEPSSSDVMQDACIRCHGAQLKRSKDTHPAKKFNDPTNAARLEVLDAQDCLTCHQEHMPERTLEMGLTMPADYCWHCHQDVADSRPSHEGMAYDSCSTAGCHNYHDNRALYEKFLNEHHGEPDHLELQLVLARETESNLAAFLKKSKSLDRLQADHPKDQTFDESLMRDWEDTLHAAAGVNCSDCHGGNEDQPWSDTVEMAACQQCHELQVESFGAGKHGMRLAAGLPAMTVGEARLPMASHASHRQLDCNACHTGHRFDTQFAAVDACLNCHADDHSLAYSDTVHAELWRDELLGSGEKGSGVSCATCHLPRLEGDDGTWVNHDQNSNLRPNEVMAREVCLNCHGLEYSLSALSDPLLITNCFASEPEDRNESVQMAKDWFDTQAKKREARKRNRK